MNNINFSDLSISDKLLDILTSQKFTKPTEIQAKTIPQAIKGNDIIGISQTGTGKTLAFMIPIIEKMINSKKQALIIVPTRELAAQVEESSKPITNRLNIKTVNLIGGESFERQLFALKRNPQIVIGTPGRILDHLKRKTFKPNLVNFLVLDEADMMLDMGFIPQVEDILKQIKGEKQTMLFSATMPKAIISIASQFMKLPVSVEVAPSGTVAEKVEQEIFIINHENKFHHLHKTIDSHKGSILVFVRTKQGASTLCEKLLDLNFKVVEIHSNLSLARRKKSLLDFKTGRAQIMVATDVAARGLDVKDIELVVNYQLPDNKEDYVHRIGRTARADKSGKAITFVANNQKREVLMIESLIRQEIKKTDFSKDFNRSMPRANETKREEKKEAPRQKKQSNKPRRPFRSDKPKNNFGPKNSSKHKRVPKKFGNRNR